MNNMKFSKLTELYFIKKGKKNYCITQMVKNLPVMPETQVQSLGQENPLEKAMTTHSCILAWRILWTEKPGGL